MIKRIHSTLFQIKDLDQTAKFYEKLGFDVKKSDDVVRIFFGDYRFAFMAERMDQKKTKGEGISIYFEVEDVKKYYEFVKEKIQTKEKPINQPWGKQELIIHDPDGYKLIFFSKIHK